MTATTTRPKRTEHGYCQKCNATPNQFHKQSCSCNQQGHEWYPAQWDNEGLSLECAWCGTITGGPRLNQ